MHASQPDESPFSAHIFGETDFARVDAHVIQPQEYEELPELANTMMERADCYIGTTLACRGHPSKGAHPRR